MKFSVVPLLVLLSAIPAAIALPEPAAVRAAEPPGPTTCSGSVDVRELAKRDNAAIVKVDGLRYRICPRTTSSCPAMGQYPINTHITLHCYTRDNTTPIEGDYGWGKVASTGYWVALAWANYVSWSGALPYC